MKEQNEPKNILLISISLILFAALTRLLPHPYNFTALGAMALICRYNFQESQVGVPSSFDSTLPNRFISGATFFYDTCLWMFCIYSVAWNPGERTTESYKNWHAFFTFLQCFFRGHQSSFLVCRSESLSPHISRSYGKLYHGYSIF